MLNHLITIDSVVWDFPSTCAYCGLSINPGTRHIALNYSPAIIHLHLSCAQTLAERLYAVETERQ